MSSQVDDAEVPLLGTSTGGAGLDVMTAPPPLAVHTGLVPASAVQADSAQTAAQIGGARISTQDNVLGPGESLFAGQALVSNNGAYTLAMQDDGNAVEYEPGGRPTWSTRTGGHPGASLHMQVDGHLLVSHGRDVLWFSGTYPYPGAYLVMQDDKNLVLYYGSTPLWASSWHSVWGNTRPSNGSDWGWCTWYAYERFKNFSGVYPKLSGNAKDWDDAARAERWLVFTEPATQAIVVFEPGVHGAHPTWGHVAWVDVRQNRADGLYIHIWEMNARGFGVISERWVKHTGGMSYILAPSL